VADVLIFLTETELFGGDGRVVGFEVEAAGGVEERHDLLIELLFAAAAIGAVSRAGGNRRRGGRFGEESGGEGVEEFGEGVSHGDRMTNGEFKMTNAPPMTNAK